MQLKIANLIFGVFNVRMKSPIILRDHLAISPRGVWSNKHHGRDSLNLIECFLWGNSKSCEIDKIINKRFYYLLRSRRRIKRGIDLVANEMEMMANDIGVFSLNTAQRARH